MFYLSIFPGNISIFSKIITEIGVLQWSFAEALSDRQVILTYPYTQSIVIISTGVVIAEKSVVSSMLVAAGPVSALNCCDIR